MSTDPIPFDEDRHDQDFRRAIADAFGMCCPQCHEPVKSHGICPPCTERIKAEIATKHSRNHN